MARFCAACLFFTDGSGTGRTARRAVDPLFYYFYGSVFAGGSIFTLGCPDFLDHSGLHSGRGSGADISV